MECLTAALESSVDTSPYPPPKRAYSKNQPRGDWGRLLYRSFGVDLTAVFAISVVTAQVLFTEIETDWSRFPTASRFASWRRHVRTMSPAGRKR